MQRKKCILDSVFSSYHDELPRTNKLAGFNVPHPQRGQQWVSEFVTQYWFSMYYGSRDI
jgi:hypothetical protein